MRNQKQEAEEAARMWNEAHAVGIRVTYRDDHGALHGTRTRSRAQVLSGHTAVVWLERRAGCVALDRVRPSRKEGAGDAA